MGLRFSESGIGRNRVQTGRRRGLSAEGAGRILAESVDEQIKGDELIQEAANLLEVMRRRQVATMAVRRGAARTLDVWAVLLPSRIVNEELGDYLEDIHRRCAEGQRWCVYVHVASAIFWTSLNAIGYAMKAVGKKRTG